MFINSLCPWNLKSIVRKERIKKIKKTLLLTNGSKNYGGTENMKKKKREYWGGFDVFKEDDQEKPFPESDIWIQMRLMKESGMNIYRKEQYRQRQQQTLRT